MANQYKIKIIFLGCLFGLFLQSCCLTDTCNRALTNINQEELMLIENGDLILRKGTGIVSSMIVDYLNDSTGFSHIGILVKENDSVYVIHSLGREFSDTEGVQQCSLADFTSELNAEEIVIVRRICSDNSDIANMAKEYLNRNIPFDRAFNFNDTTAFSCLELPYRILERLNDHHEGLTNFKIFTNPSLFEVVVDKRRAML